MEVISKEELLNRLGALIEVSDSELVNNRSCFPCHSEEHQFYKTIRDCLKTIYEEADYVRSNKFLSETEGKSEQLVLTKSKMLNRPEKQQHHRQKLLKMLSSLATIKEAAELINQEHQLLYSKALVNLDKCSDV